MQHLPQGIVEISEVPDDFEPALLNRALILDTVMGTVTYDAP